LNVLKRKFQIIGYTQCAYFCFIPRPCRGQVVMQFLCRRHLAFQLYGAGEKLSGRMRTSMTCTCRSGAIFSGFTNFPPLIDLSSLRFSVFVLQKRYIPMKLEHYCHNVFQKLQLCRYTNFWITCLLLNSIGKKHSKYRVHANYATVPKLLNY